MKWRDIEHDWEDVKGEFQRYWSKLSDDDLEYVDGNRRRLEETLREHYELRPSEAKHFVERFARRLEPPSTREHE